MTGNTDSSFNFSLSLFNFLSLPSLLYSVGSTNLLEFTFCGKPKEPYTGVQLEWRLTNHTLQVLNSGYRLIMTSDQSNTSRNVSLPASAMSAHLGHLAGYQNYTFNIQLLLSDKTVLLTDNCTVDVGKLAPKGKVKLYRAYSISTVLYFN